MTPGKRIPLLSLIMCAAVSIAGIHSAIRASETYTCKSGRPSCYQSGYTGLTPTEEHGRDTWYFWTGGDLDASGKQVVGDQALWRILAVQSHGTFDLLQAVDSRYRGQRFKLFGVISDPDCTKAIAPDEYGLWLDNCTNPDVPKLADVPGEPTGIVGLRKFRNPKFSPSGWDVAKYRADPSKVEPPYLIGVACGFCHVGFNPQHPPADPENPQWHNLHPGIGNQYFKEQLFNTAKYPPERGLKTSDFRWQVANAQPAGTSETSQVATDHINNPNAINNIASLNFRPKHTERTADGVERDVYHVLKDGADSIGSACLDDPKPDPGVNDTACAALRVYVNIGLCASIWTTLQDPVYGLKRPQSVFDPKQARQENSACNEGWLATQARMGGLEAFLRTQPPLRLADAEGGASHVPTDEKVISRGKVVFAENCARCHSSKRPPLGYQGDEKEWYRSAVMKDDFLTDNFLSDDARHSATELGTNIERAMASNATEGHIWQNFSSDTYKKQPDVEITGLVNPLHPDLPLLPVKATGGRGYYRTPTLANVWATAPFFHNNSLGMLNNDPSIEGRLSAYQDAMEKLLWPKRRPGLKTIRKTTQASTFTYEEGGTVCVARNTPIDLIANIDLVTPANFRTDNFFTRLLCHITGTGHLNGLFLLADNAPDFVQDRGHTFGSELPDEDKRALIEYLKLF
jgi:mono/diheme cytochrome c family protein